MRVEAGQSLQVEPIGRVDQTLTPVDRQHDVHPGARQSRAASQRAFQEEELVPGPPARGAPVLRPARLNRVCAVGGADDQTLAGLTVRRVRARARIRTDDLPSPAAWRGRSPVAPPSPSCRPAGPPPRRATDWRRRGGRQETARASASSGVSTQRACLPVTADRPRNPAGWRGGWPQYCPVIWVSSRGPSVVWLAVVCLYDSCPFGLRACFACRRR